MPDKLSDKLSGDVQAIFIPFVGILGNECNRIFLIAIGSLWWGGMSIGFGFAHRFQEVCSTLAIVCTLQNITA